MVKDVRGISLLGLLDLTDPSFNYLIPAISSMVKEEAAFTSKSKTSHHDEKDFMVLVQQPLKVLFLINFHFEMSKPLLLKFQLSKILQMTNQKDLLLFLVLINRLNVNLNKMQNYSFIIMLATNLVVRYLQHNQYQCLEAFQEKYLMYLIKYSKNKYPRTI